MKAERWQLRLEFSVPNDGIDYRPRLDAMVQAMREMLGEDFIDHTSLSFVCERIDVLDPGAPRPCVPCADKDAAITTLTKRISDLESDAAYYDPSEMRSIL